MPLVISASRRVRKIGQVFVLGLSSAMRNRWIFDGHIAGIGTASGLRAVVGLWAQSPFGPFADAMVQLPSGHRILLAPTEEAGDFISAVYNFDETLIVQSMMRGAGTAAPVADDYPFAERDVFDRPDFPRLHFVERRYAGDQTNWWIPNLACAEAMLRSAGFAITARPAPEVLFCRTVALETALDNPPLHVELAPARRDAERAGAHA